MQKFKEDKDKFLYKIQYLTEEETIYLNTLMMNEAMRAIAFKTPKLILSSIRKYMIMYNDGTPNVKRNYSGLIQLLIKEMVKKND